MTSNLTRYIKFCLATLLLLSCYNISSAQKKITSIPKQNTIKDTTIAGDSLNNKRGGFADFGSVGEGKDSKKDTIKHFYILDLLDIVDRSRKSYSWRVNPLTYNTEEENVGFDTVLFQPHLIYPYQKDLIPYMGLGNLGAPVQSVDFFTRNQNTKFLFSKNLEIYQKDEFSRIHYNVKTPHTLLKYSMGGKSSQAEQILGIIHTQNVNQFLNFGLEFDYYNSKGMYINQLTRDNDFSLFTSYYKDRIFGQFTFNSTSIKNQENGGVTDEHYIVDTVMESRLVPMMLNGASTEFKKKSLSLMAGYNIVEKRKHLKDIKNQDSTIIKPIISSKIIFEIDRYKRVYVDEVSDSAFYTNFYIYPTGSHDSVSMTMFSTTALVEINQIAKFPGVPGLRAWITNTSGSYKFFEIDNLLYSNTKNKISTNLFGVGVYSKSDYLNYSGSVRLYLNGYRAEDKEIFGEISILPWKSKDLPYVKGELSITDREPDVFVKEYFSNHYKWNNNFDKQGELRFSAEIGADKWNTWLGYKMSHVSNYIYFNGDGLPEQAADGMTITSAYVRNHLKLGWFRFVNKLVWQKNSNEDVLSLPELSLYSSFYLQHDLVKGVLTGQLGVSAFFNTTYYADGYIPATGQFYRQRERLTGGYPFVDAFINLKWKEAVIFLKYEHINQGYPDNDFFIGYKYPANQQTFKFGISWMFYN